MKHLAPLAALLLGGCVSASGSLSEPARLTATDSDRQRLRDWRQAFTAGLAGARAAGHAEDIRKEGALLVPDAAIGGGIPNGLYRCRVVKLGARQQEMPAYIAYPAFSCRVAASGRGQLFTKLSGSQRPVGMIAPRDQLRSTFLGTLVLGDELRAMAYGTDPERDLAGWVERVGDRRWRLLLPYPRFESLIDVVELVPTQ